MLTLACIGRENDGSNSKASTSNAVPSDHTDGSYTAEEIDAFVEERIQAKDSMNAMAAEAKARGIPLTMQEIGDAIVR